MSDGITIAGLLEHAKALAEARMDELEIKDNEWWRYYELSKKLTPLVFAADQAERLIGR